MDYLIRLVQVHQSFRLAEIQALAEAAQLDIDILFYNDDSPFCIVRLANEAAARSLIRRSILGKGIYELWGTGSSYAAVHEDVRSRRTRTSWSRYASSSFRFDFDSFQNKRGSAEQRSIIDSFTYLGFGGAIKMHGPEQVFCVFEEWAHAKPGPSPSPGSILSAVHLGRWLAAGSRDLVRHYDLKKRGYISTTSMDSELALITANIALAGPNKIFYDPFVGTGSFPIACAHFGAATLGSDIDGRIVRGSSSADGVNVLGNFQQYGLERLWLDGFTADLTNSPVRTTASRWLDGIVCDPPYGVREGLKVLGRKDPDRGREEVWVNGKPSHLQPHFVPPKKPYSFTAMLDDILSFAASTLVDDGRLSLWMPTTDDSSSRSRSRSRSRSSSEDAQEASKDFAIPSHPALELVSVCVQPFNKWARRLLTYRRLPGDAALSLVAAEGDADDAIPIVASAIATPKASSAMPSDGNPAKNVRAHADELNPFRRRYFQGFASKPRTRDEQAESELESRR
ncbi:MAG: hypothetical protein M1826_001102 [Phylliscum demangeonii]|nr:MAG: hypothetical protein M1826_001102 [Phylliscum demangeonii]